MGITITRDIGRTLDSFVFFLTCVAVFYVVYEMDEQRRAGICRFFLVGVALNFVMALLQFASASPTVKFAGFPYEMTGGFFANNNHLSALLYVSIPFFLLGFRNTALSFISYVIIFFITAFEFVVASAAGVGLSLACALASIAWLGDSRPLKLATLGLAVVAAVGGLFILPHILDVNLAGGLSRKVFAINTVHAIKDYWLLGSGFGTFTLVYPSYVGTTGIFHEFVNHAHNDYLELILEGGILMVVVFALYAVLLLRKLFSGRLENLQKVAFLGIVFLLLHSLVDYPLRTMAMAVTFAFLNGLYLAPNKRPRARTAKTSSSRA